VRIFVNSYPFIFMKFLVKFYRANFFSWASNVKKGVHGKRDRTGPQNRVGWPAWFDWLKGVPTAVRPGFSLERAFLTTLFGQKNLRKV
jgi:hypothetical protein